MYVCKVLAELHVYRYEVTADDLLKLRKFPSDEALEMVIEGRKKFKRSK